MNVTTKKQMKGVAKISDSALLLEGMAFHAYHGGLKEEQLLGQKFIIDLELTYNMQTSCETDQLSEAFNYIEVYNIVERVVCKERFNLIQALAYRIAKELFIVCPESRAVITIRKPASAVKGILNYATVRLTVDGPQFEEKS